MPYAFNFATGKLDFYKTGISQSAADLRYLKLDCSNDPLTGNLDLGANDLTTTGTVQAEQITSTDDISMQGHLLHLGDGSANDIIIQFVGSTSSGALTFDQTNDVFDFGLSDISLTGTVTANTYIADSGYGLRAGTLGTDGVLSLVTGSDLGGSGEISLTLDGSLDNMYFQNDNGDVLYFTPGLIADSTGTISFDDENLTTTGTITAGQIIDNGLTASELIATDGSKQLTSLAVATYPSLTELSYVKGVTSAIQTQLNGKLDGSLTAGRVPYASDANTLTDSANLTFDGNTLFINVASGTTASQLQVGANIGGVSGTCDFSVDSPAAASYVRLAHFNCSAVNSRGEFTVSNSGVSNAWYRNFITLMNYGRDRSVTNYLSENNAGWSMILAQGEEVTHLAIGCYHADPITFFTNNTRRMYISNLGLIGIGSNLTSPNTLLEINGAAGTNKHVLELDQDDTDEPFIKYDGTSAADQTKSISTVNGDGAVEGPKNYSAQAGWAFVGMIRIDVNGTDFWMPYYSADTS